MYRFPSFRIGFDCEQKMNQIEEQEMVVLYLSRNFPYMDKMGINLSLNKISFILFSLN